MANMENDPKAKEVLEQEISADELDAVAGGSWWASEKDADQNNCIQNHERYIYGGNGFPNCAATVEDGSHCGTNDACYSDAVEYHGFKGGCSVIDCKKAWE